MSDHTGRFFGVVPAMATPFDHRQELDEGRVRALCDWYVSAGVHGLSVAGSQGEFFSLSDEERLRLIDVALRAVDGRVPVYAGTGAVTTRESIRLTQAAEAMGADLALVITPYFVQPSQDELVEHFRAIAASTKLPVMLYNNPPRTSVNLLPGTLSRAMASDNIVGVKDSSGDLTQSIEYLLGAPRRALLFAGRDTIALAMLMHGAQGTISPAANVFPRLMVRMVDAQRAGDLAEATRISNVFAPLRAAWALGSFPVVIKEAMAMAGQDAGPPRSPIAPLPPAARKTLRDVVDRILAEDSALARSPSRATRDASLRR